MALFAGGSYTYKNIMKDILHVIVEDSPDAHRKIRNMFPDLATSPLLQFFFWFANTSLQQLGFVIKTKVCETANCNQFVKCNIFTVWVA